jgi:D-amino peptidase
MKVLISADIEGITGTTVWDETEKKHPDYAEFREQMTAEVAAACEGALNAGASEILVKDAHDSARNLIPERLPREARLSRGWSGHPYLMVDGLDFSYGALMMIGYHSRAGSGANPLSHTMTGSVTQVKINGRLADEFTINAYTAALERVPVAFVSGDAGLCADAASLVPGVTTVAVKQGVGHATINIHPHLAVEQIRAGVQKALQGDLLRCRLALPDHFQVEMHYKEHTKAYGVSFFPGASLKDDLTVQFDAQQYFDVLRFFSFAF